MNEWMQRERKDDLTSSTQYFSEGKYLTQAQLKVCMNLKALGAASEISISYLSTCVFIFGLCLNMFPPENT